TKKHTDCLRMGYREWPTLEFGKMPAMGDARWTVDLIFSIWHQAGTGLPPTNGLEYRIGDSEGGFDLLDFGFLPENKWIGADINPNLSIPLNRRNQDRKIEIPVPFYGSGMSYGSVSEHIMLARAKAAHKWNTFTCTGEGGYPQSLVPYKDNVITQIATGM